jgi:hypothetical protein
MCPLDYLTDAPHACSANDANVVTIEEGTTIIRGRDAIKHLLACSIWSVSDD